MNDYKDDPKRMLKVLANPKNKALYLDNEISISKEDVNMTANLTLYGNDHTGIYKNFTESDKINNDSMTFDFGFSFRPS